MPLPSHPLSLLAGVDAFIKTHGLDPDLARDLETLRSQLEAGIANRRRTDIANTALRIAQLIKFAFDLLDGSG